MNDQIITVDDALETIRRRNCFEQTNVIIVDEQLCCTYTGTVNYFIFNGAYDWLREKKVINFNPEKGIIVYEEKVL